jgi:hypothetical protein
MPTAFLSVILSLIRNAAIMRTNIGVEVIITAALIGLV